MSPGVASSPSPTVMSSSSSWYDGAWSGISTSGFSIERTLAAQPQLLGLGLDVDAVQPREVAAEDLALGLVGQLRVAALGHDVVGQLEVPERLQRPLRVPDRRLAAVEDLVLAAPPQH